MAWLIKELDRGGGRVRRPGISALNKGSDCLKGGGEETQWWGDGGWRTVCSTWGGNYCPTRNSGTRPGPQPLPANHQSSFFHQDQPLPSPGLPPTVQYTRGGLEPQVQQLYWTVQPHSDKYMCCGRKRIWRECETHLFHINIWTKLECFFAWPFSSLFLWVCFCTYSTVCSGVAGAD
jgi:hypothetical protein